jgi:hypothetical protein
VNDALRDARSFLAELRTEWDFDPAIVRPDAVEHLRAVGQ